MSEYWVSKKKYFCTYCKIYITDDVPSRQQHENGMRHIGNKERYVRGLYKNAEKKKLDDEEERREMRRIELAAHASFAVDVGAGRGGSSSATAHVPATQPAGSSAKPKKPSNPYANYTTAADLGIVDEDDARPDAATAIRQGEGRVGEWTVVTPTASHVVHEGEPGWQDAQKRDAPAEDADDTWAFQVKRRKVSVGLGEIYDPGVIKVKKKEEKASAKEEQAGTALSLPDDVDTKKSSGPKWAPVSWSDATTEAAVEHGQGSRLGETTALEGPAHPASGLAQDILPPGAPTKTDEADVNIKQEAAPVSVSASSVGLFRKRKAPASASSGGHRPA